MGDGCPQGFSLCDVQLSNKNRRVTVAVGETDERIPDKSEGACICDGDVNQRVPIRYSVRGDIVRSDSAVWRGSQWYLPKL